MRVLRWSACLVALAVGAALSEEVVDLAHDDLSSLEMLSENEGHMQQVWPATKLHLALGPSAEPPGVL